MAEAHIRIDEGVKRGPKMRQGKLTRRSPKADLGSWVIPADLDPEKVIERYLSEKTTSQIASEYGLSRKALTRWMRQVKPDEWRQAQTLRALCIKEDAEETMQDADNALSLARARELLKSAQFDLTSLDPDYRPKQEITVQVGDLGDRLRRARERVIEAEVLPIAAPAALTENPT